MKLGVGVDSPMTVETIRIVTFRTEFASCGSADDFESLQLVLVGFKIVFVDAAVAVLAVAEIMI